MAKGKVEGAGAHLLSQTHQDHNQLQSDYQQQQKKRLETTRKDLLELKTQRRNHDKTGRRGGLQQSGPIPVRGTTHKLENNYTAKPLLWERGPHVRLPSSGVWYQEEEPPVLGSEGHATGA